MRPIITDGVAWSVTIMIHAKTAQVIEMPLGLCTRARPSK